jgi:hypothetical protein
MSNLGRDDVERIVENMLESLTVEVSNSDSSDLNSRKLTLNYKGRQISSTYFDVEDKGMFG